MKGGKAESHKKKGATISVLPGLLYQALTEAPTNYLTMTSLKIQPDQYGMATTK